MNDDRTIQEIAMSNVKTTDPYLEDRIDKLAVRVLALEVIIQQLAAAILSATDSLEEFDKETHDH